MTQSDYPKETIQELFLGACEKYADKTAFTCMGQDISYSELEVLSAKFAAYLQAQPFLNPGDRIAIQMPNILQYPVVLFGVIRAGFIIVNTNPLYTARELKHQLNDSGAKMLVVLANFASTAAEVVDETPVETVVVTEIGDMHGGLKRPLLNLVTKYVKKMVPNYSLPTSVRFRDALNQGSRASLKEATSQSADLAILQYTGGTTGVAKGAMLSHGNIAANRIQLTERIIENLTEGEEVFAVPLPLYHIYAFTLHCMMLLCIGARNVLIPNPRDLDGLIKTIDKEKITGFVGLNTLFSGLCNHPEFSKLDFSRLNTTSSGGMALTHAAAEAWQEITHCEILEGYGLTETSPCVSVNPPGGVQLGTVGLPLKWTEVSMRDEDGKEVPQGEAGELWIRGPQVMGGYWQRPEETDKVITEEGWFKSGDIGVVQPDGYVKIVDRLKDMVLISGFNVYPNEIEDVICSHPKVLEAAAIGVPDPVSGERLKVFIVKKEDDLTEEEIIKFSQQKLTGYKVPKLIEFRDDLPKSNVGKILRRELKVSEGQ